MEFKRITRWVDRACGLWGLIGLVWLMGPACCRAQDSTLVVELPEGQRIELVWVEGGTFTMGSNTARGVSHNYDATRPEHRVTVAGFYMARFEVTQGVWKAVMGENPSKFTSGDSLPVEQVLWGDAQQFVTLLSQMTGSVQGKHLVCSSCGNKITDRKYLITDGKVLCDTCCRAQRESQKE